MHHLCRSRPAAGPREWQPSAPGLLSLLARGTIGAGERTADIFRRRSIVLEYREAALSCHGGCRTRIPRDPGADRSEADGFDPGAGFCEQLGTAAGLDVGWGRHAPVAAFLVWSVWLLAVGVYLARGPGQEARHPRAAPAPT